MATLTIKQVPEDLYDRLKARARARRRSLNAQVIHDLEVIVDRTHSVDHAARLEEARRLRRKITTSRLTDEVLHAARQWGRE